MYIDHLKSIYLPAVAALEKKLYPEKLRFGVEGLEEEFNRYSTICYSWTVFKKGMLQGYIWAHRKSYNDDELYISDLACKDVKCLKFLLLKFFEEAGNKTFHAHMRMSSYKLLKKQAMKNPEAISIIKEETLESYYLTGETAYEVFFSVNYDELIKNDWKTEFLIGLSSMYINREDGNLMEMVFELLRKPISNGVNLYDTRNKNFILNSIREYILDYYQMFDEKILVETKFEIPIRRSHENSDKLARINNTLEEKGYEANGLKQTVGKYYHYYSDTNLLYLAQRYYIWNTRYKESLSGFRWLQTKERNRIKKLKNICRVTYYDRYGGERVMPAVPYITEKKYLYYLKKNEMIVNIGKKLQLKEKDYEYQQMKMLVKGIFYLLSRDKAIECINRIAGRYDSKLANYFHDWNLIVSSLYTAKSILTEGAVLYFLKNSYNKAAKAIKEVEAINGEILSEKKISRHLSIKEIRKQYSRLLRNDMDRTEYISQLFDTRDQLIGQQMNIPEKYRPLLGNYIRRLKKYDNYITFHSVCKFFNKKRMLSFVIGDAACIFQPAVLSPSYKSIAQNVKTFLGVKSKVAKRVYNKLQRSSLILPIMKEQLDKEQVDKVIEILKFHNVNVKTDNIEKFKCVIERKGSPEFLMAGNASVCCMSYGSAKAYTYAVEEGFGIINIYYNDRVIANSLIWINEPYNCLVLDNIEVHPNYCRFLMQLENCFRTAVKYLMKNYGLYFAVQGKGYNDLKLYEDGDKEICFEKMRPRKVNSKMFYSDADSSVLIDSYLTDKEINFILEKGAEGFSSASFFMEFLKKYREELYQILVKYRAK